MGTKAWCRSKKRPLEAVDTHLINRQLTELYAGDEREMRGISVISAGQAADHVPMCGLNISYYDPKPQGSPHQAGCARRSGTVLRDKKIKAIVVRYSNVGGDSNGLRGSGPDPQSWPADQQRNHRF